jgi:hypothetical protein
MKDGIYTDVTIQDYLSNKTHLSSTQVRTAKRSLKEFDWQRRGLIRSEEKSHFDFGNAFELALLSPVEFAEKVAIMKDSEWVEAAMAVNHELLKPRSSKTYQALCTEFEQENKGKYHIIDKGPESYERIKLMMESCYQDEAIQALIKNTEYQVTVFWTHEETGLKLKTRPDICKRKKNVLVNVKTCEDGSPKAFSKELVKWDYPMQAAHEIAGALSSGLIETIDNYFWLVCEKVPPYNATIYEFRKEDIEVSLDELFWTYKKIARAENEKLYPGYSDAADNKFGILEAVIPPYYRMV